LPRVHGMCCIMLCFHDFLMCASVHVLCVLMCLDLSACSGFPRCMLSDAFRFAALS
jgi:hypothetical protein